MHFDLSIPLRIDEHSLARLGSKTDEAAVRRVWKIAQAQELAESDPTVLGTYIIRTAYRLVREWARTLGVLSYDSALSSLSVDRLLIAQPYSDPPLGPFSIKAYAQLRKIIEDPALAQNESMPQGIPLLPSHHEHFTKKHSDAFGTAMANIARFLRMDQAYYANAALPYLIPPEPRNWPEPNLLYAYEGAVIDEILGIVIETGTRDAESFMQTEHGMLPHEARGLTRLAKLEARARMEAAIEDDRAVLSMRLENLIHRARESLDMRVELGAIKQLAIVQGVTRAEPEDAFAEFARVVRKVSATPEAPPQLP